VLIGQLTLVGLSDRAFRWIQQNYHLKSNSSEEIMTHFFAAAI
jgi:hypothetical protein